MAYPFFITTEVNPKIESWSLNSQLINSNLIIQEKSTNEISIARKYYSRKTQNEQYNLGHYLAGLLEGDGYISLTNENRIILGITFHIKDKPLAFHLLNKIQQGANNQKGTIINRKTKSIELRFSDKKNLEYIVNLINGKFRTPKIHQLHIVIEWLNKNHNTQIVKKNINLGDLDKDYWLAGFIDSDGGFFIRHSPKQIACNFYLEQRIIYPKTNDSYKNIIETISCFLKAKLAIRDRVNYLNDYYIIRVENKKSAEELIKYLEIFSLNSSKYLDFLAWRNSFEIVKNKIHLTKEGKLAILEYKNSMNDKRTRFNWDHLKNL